MSKVHRLLRMADLRDRRIVNSHQQLHRLQDQWEFPPGWMHGGLRVWYEDEIEAWLEKQREASHIRPLTGAAATLKADRLAREEAQRLAREAADA